MRSVVSTTFVGGRYDLRRVRVVLDYCLSKAFRKARVESVVSLVLTDDAYIRNINRAHLGHDCPTDVIAFSFLPLPTESAPRGEIFVNAEMAARVGKRFCGKDRELALYIAHGCDHLSGEEDSTPQLRRRMRQRELRWLRDAGGTGLIKGLICT
jgi:probable rRNA maturation factor